MPTDEAKISATRSRPTYSPTPIPQEKSLSPWIPFIVSFVLIAVTAAGLFFYMDEQFKKMEASLLKTNDFVLDMNQRLKKIEGDITASDAEAEQAGSSLTSKVMNLESRLAETEKSVSWNSSRITKQITDSEGIQTTVNQVSNNMKEVQSTLNQLSENVSSQASKVSNNTIKIAEQADKIAALTNKEDGSAALTALTQKVETNTQAIGTIDAHRTRLSEAIQKVQADTARLIRLYEKDNPTATRVQ